MTKSLQSLRNPNPPLNVKIDTVTANSVTVSAQGGDLIAYQGENVVSQGKNQLTISALNPATKYAKGNFQIGIVANGLESDLVDVPSFTTEEIYPTSIKLDKTSADGLVGETIQLISTVLPDNVTNNTVTWTTGNSTIATVNSEGLVTIVGEGKVRITAKVGNKSVYCEITALPAE